MNPIDYNKKYNEGLGGRNPNNLYDVFEKATGGGGEFGSWVQKLTSNPSEIGWKGGANLGGNRNEENQALFDHIIQNKDSLLPKLVGTSGVNESPTSFNDPKFFKPRESGYTNNSNNASTPPASGITAQMRALNPNIGQTNTQTNTAQPTQSQFALTGGQNLKVGSKSTDVSNLQKLLGGGLVVDGNYGPKTQAAVIAFQKANGLTPDGIVGPLTAQKLAQMGGGNTQTTDTGSTTNTNASGGNTGSNTTSTGTSTTNTNGIDQNSYEGQVKALMGLTPEEQKLKDEQTALDATLKNFDKSNEQMNLNIKGQPIAQGFLTGQQAALQEQSGITRTGITNDQQTLQQKLANAQAKRQASFDVAKFGMDREDKAREFTLKEKELSAKDTGFTLNEGDRRFDKNGKLIASGGAKTYAPTGTGDLSSKQYAALNQMTTKFQADPIIKQTLQANTANTIADQIIANPDSATNQLKSLYVLVKNLDPDSAVKEGEIQLANQTQSYLQQFGNTLARITSGRVVSPDAAVELANATKELMTAWSSTAKLRQQQYTSQANVLNVGDAFNSYIQGSNLGYNQSGSTGGSSPKQMVLNGKTLTLQADGTYK